MNKAIEEFQVYFPEDERSDGYGYVHFKNKKQADLLYKKRMKFIKNLITKKKGKK